MPQDPTASPDQTYPRTPLAERNLTPTERRSYERLALSLVETCVRNTQLEGLHAGHFPHSATGDYSDVKIVTPDDDIPWTSLSRISDPEMKSLMIEIVDRVFTFLQYPEEWGAVSGAAAGWDRPKLDPNLMHLGQHHRPNGPKTPRSSKK